MYALGDPSSGALRQQRRRVRHPAACLPRARRGQQPRAVRAAAGGGPVLLERVNKMMRMTACTSDKIE